MRPTPPAPADAPLPLLPSPAPAPCSYTLYCKHPVWKRVVGEQVAEATLELEQYNSGTISQYSSMALPQTASQALTLDKPVDKEGEAPAAAK